MRNCLVLGAQELHTDDYRVIGEANTLRIIHIRVDSSKIEALGNTDNPPREAVEKISLSRVLVIDTRGEWGARVIANILALRLHYKGMA